MQYCADRPFSAGGESVVVAAKDESKAKAFADELGPNARATSVEDAIAAADAIVLALWLDDLREVIPQQAHLLDGKVVVDPSNPVGFDRNGQIFRTLPDEQSAGSIVAVSGTQIHRSCCAGVFVDQSAESVASVELAWRVRSDVA